MSVNTAEKDRDDEQQQERDLFSEIGKLTRQLHDSLNNFQVDSKLSAMTEQEIPDAKARLRHVITMTEDAANQTMTAVESVVPASEKLQSLSREVSGKWQQFRNRQLSVEEFREMSKQLDAFFAYTEENTQTINSQCNEILLAQGFQDLTGQIIKRVIELVEDVEDSLVKLIRLGGQSVAEQVAQATSTAAADSQGFGPDVPGVDKGETVSGQDDVDELLSSLGF